jgi:hypothetical protein
MTNRSSHVDRDFVLDRCSEFVEFQLWPPEAETDPARWLNNFQAGDAEHAQHLLNGFVYLAEPLTNRIFSAGFHSLSEAFSVAAADFQTAALSWRMFCDRLVVTYVTGEAPNPSDSGYMFARKARTVLGFAEDQLLPPAEALAAAQADPTLPVLFVDDFVGSGNQFVETWQRQYGTASFASLLQAHGSRRFFYCPAICTEYGAENIRAECPYVTLSPGHVIPREYSALHPRSVIWPEHLRESGPEFVKRVSLAAGIPDLGGNVGDYRGFHCLGLTIAFSHSPPDATLPLFYWEHNGWHPLVRRR